MVVFDTSVLAIAFDQNACVPKDPATGQPLERCKERIDHLLKTLTATKAKILIPTPVLAEYMVHGGPDRQKRLNKIVLSRVFTVAPFDMRAAVECAELEPVPRKAKAITHFDNETKAKVKFDRQILATALTHRVSHMYTGDNQLARKARDCGLLVTLTWELPLPPEKPKSPQFEIAFQADHSAHPSMP
ncbi:hypothetical protein ACUTR7_16010 [Delftia sp. NA_296.1]|uniref:hypothetical protein n=1 Tax=Delftia sp. NA_296.1 TaxID=3415648 RepID=UPI0040452518